MDDLEIPRVAGTVERSRHRAMTVALIRRLAADGSVSALSAAVRAVETLCKIDCSFGPLLAAGANVVAPANRPFRSRCTRLDLRALLRAPAHARRLALDFEPRGAVLAELMPDRETLEVSYSGALAWCSPQRFKLEARPCGGFGGARPTAERLIAVCPCGRRAYVFYGTPGRTPFGCRACVPVLYDSTRIATTDRAAARASRLRVELGGSGELDAPIPPPPWAQNGRRMRRERYARTVERITSDEQRFFGAVEKVVDRLKRAAQ